MYRLTNNGVIRIADSAHIPDDTKNRDWRKYQYWVEGGKTPAAAEPIPPEPPHPMLKVVNAFDAALSGDRKPLSALKAELESS